MPTPSSPPCPLQNDGWSLPLLPQNCDIALACLKQWKILGAPSAMLSLTVALSMPAFVLQAVNAPSVTMQCGMCWLLGVKGPACNLRKRNEAFYSPSDRLTLGSHSDALLTSFCRASKDLHLPLTSPLLAFSGRRPLPKLVLKVAALPLPMLK